MSSKMASYVLIWLIALITGLVVRYVLPTGWGISYYSGRSYRVFPMKAVAFWMVLVIAATLSVVKLLVRRYH